MGLQVTQDGLTWTVGATATRSVTFARPNDSNQYTAGDVIADSSAAGVANILRFPNLARSDGGGGIIESALLIDSVAAATKPDTELYLFDQIVIMQSDNAVWAPVDAEAQYAVGAIAFPLGSFRTMGANGLITATGLGMAYNCAPGSRTLYGILVARNAYTPAALEQFEIRLQALLD